MTEVWRRPSARRPNAGGVIEAVRARSIAAEIGLQPGDRVFAIDGRQLRDAVDYQFHAAEPSIAIEVFRGGQRQVIEIDKQPDEDLGIEFQDAAFDGVRTCNNACFFCFLKGNPRGMRKTLYVKDDDYRLSFFHGNFVTLTNLTEDDWSRLDEQRLSPLNVSVHATDVALRRYLLGNAHAPDIVQQLRRLGDLGIRAHTQVVLCPGVNDGSALHQTIEELAVLYPTVQTISIVPVGATETAEERIERGWHADEVDGCTPAYAREIVEQVRPYQQRCRRAHRRTLVYLADEFYLAAAIEPPSAAHYDGFEQYENGIGMARSLIDDWQRVRRRFARVQESRRLSFACGTLIAPILLGVARELQATSGIRAEVHVLDNHFFGPRINVSGLLVARDIERQLRGRDLGELLVLPRYALDYTGHRFLDDITPSELQDSLNVPLAFAANMSDVLRILRGGVESQQISGPRLPKTNGKAWVDWSLEAPARGGRGLAKEVRR